MTRQEKQKAIDALKISAPVMTVTQEEFNNYIQTLNQVMDWLEQEPCDDCISRKAAFDIVDSHSDSQSNVEDVTQDIISGIMALPPVTPQQKMGKWIHARVGKLFPSNDYKCSVCGNILDFNGVNCGRGDANYCPNCGAKMQEVNE